MKPETPLPWDGLYPATAFGIGKEREQNAAFATHAANAYPKLVEALRQAIYELGMEGVNGAGDNIRNITRSDCISLLRSLGEI